MSSNKLEDLSAGPAALKVSNGGPDLPRELHPLHLHGFKREFYFTAARPGCEHVAANPNVAWRIGHVTKTRACRIWPSLPLRLHVHKTRGYDTSHSVASHLPDITRKTPRVQSAIFTPPLLRSTFILSWHPGVLSNKSWKSLLKIAPQIKFENHRAICSTQRLCSPRPGLCPASGLQPILSAS